MLKTLLYEMLSAVLQGIGWTIGMTLCGFAFLAFHLLLWPVLILLLPVTIIVFWRNPHFIGDRWRQVRQRIWESMRVKYGYRHPTLPVIESASGNNGVET